MKRLSNWVNMSIGPEASIKDVLELLDFNGHRLALVVAKNQLIGTVSDGDIRRGLMAGLSIDQSLDQIINRDPVKFVNSVLTRDIELATKRGVQHVPLVDDNQIVKAVYTQLNPEWKSPVRLVNQDKLPIVVMAGGFGKRLGALTKETPKALVEVDGTPMLEHIIWAAKIQGYTRFIFCLHHMSGAIEEYFGDGERFGVEVEYQVEQNPAGTAGALKYLNLGFAEHFLVTNCDIISGIQYDDLLEIQKNKDADIVIASATHEYMCPFGVLNCNNSEVIGLQEKPISRFKVCAGVYLISRRVLQFVSEDYLDMPHLIERAIDAGLKVTSFDLDGVWFDVGRPADILAASKFVNGAV